MAKATIVLDKRYKSKGGHFPIKIRIVSGKTSDYVLTKYSVLPSFFSSGELISKKCKDIENVSKANNEILKMVSDIQQIIDSIPVQNEPPNAKEIKEKYLNRELSRNNDFFGYFDKFIHEKGIRNERTAQIYRVTYNHIRNFTGGCDFDFKQVNVPFCRAFESYLLGVGGVNNAAIHLRNLRAVLNAAIDDETIDLSNYPFRRFKIRKETTEKRNISLGQLILLRDAKLTGVPELARDMFMLSFYLVGINLKDLSYCKPTKGGYITYRRAKTGRLYKIRVESEAEAIIEKYRSNDYLVDLTARYQNYTSIKKEINKKLKVVAEVIGVDREISTYYARHTWATLARTLAGVTKDDIASSLGHAGRTVTDVYIEESQSIVDNANRKVLDLLWKRPEILPKN